MRKFTLDNKEVICPNATLLGLAKRRAKRGDILVYKEPFAGGYLYRTARSLGRISTCDIDGDICVGHICAVVPNESFTHAGIRWINPIDVVEVQKCPNIFPHLFFSPIQFKLDNKSAVMTAKEIDGGYWAEPYERR